MRPLTTMSDLRSLLVVECTDASIVIASELSVRRRETLVDVVECPDEVEWQHVLSGAADVDDGALVNVSLVRPEFES